MEKYQIEDSKVLLLEDIIKKLWKKRLFILGVCSTVLIISIIYIVSLPRTYRTEVTLLPEVVTDGGLSGNLGSLASLAGVKLGSGSSEDAIYPEFYPKVVASTPFVMELRDVPIITDDKKKMTFYSYVMDNQKLPWWSAFFHLIFSKNKIEEETKDIQILDSTKAEVFQLTKKQLAFEKNLRQMITCRVDKKTDMVTIDVEMQDPIIAAYMADVIKEKLQTYITNYRTSKARNDMLYMEKIVEDSRKDYLEAQHKYAVYADSYKSLVLETFSQEQDRLESEMQLAYTVYSQAFQQLQLAKAKVQEHTPVFVTVQPAVVAEKPSGPKRMVFVFMMGVLSFLLSSSWVLFKESYKQAHRK